MIPVAMPPRKPVFIWAATKPPRVRLSRMPASTPPVMRPTVAPRRAGDPDRIVASGELAARDLDWRMRHTLHEMVSSAWQARQAAGDAYPR